MRLSKRMRLSLLIGAPVVVALAVALVAGYVVAGAHAAKGGSPASYWHIGYYAGAGLGASMADAPSVPDGIARLNFTNGANTSLLVTDNKAKFPSLLGDLTSAHGVSASVALSGLRDGASFIYYGGFCGSSTSYVRLYFETSNAGGFNETHYWWSNPVHWDLSSNGSATLTTTFDGAGWSDFYGHYGNNPSYAAGYAAALSNVTEIGLSFGGGCFFENGVGTTDGSGTFTLTSFTVS